MKAKRPPGNGPDLAVESLGPSVGESRPDVLQNSLHVLSDCARDLLEVRQPTAAGVAHPLHEFVSGDVDLATVKNHMTGKGQLILGQIDGLVYLSVASNADEATTRQLLGAIDFAALHKMVAETKAEAAQLASAAGGTPRVGGLLSGDDCVRKGAGKFCAVGN